MDQSPRRAAGMGDNEEQSKEISAADKVTGVPRVGIGVVVLNHENRVLIGKRKSKLGQGTSFTHLQTKPIRNMVTTRSTFLPSYFN